MTTVGAQHLMLYSHHLLAQPSEPLKTLPLFSEQEESLAFFGDSFFHPKDFPIPQAAVQTVALALLGVCEAPAWNCGEAGCYSEMFCSLPAISGPRGLSVHGAAAISKIHPFIPLTPPRSKIAPIWRWRVDHVRKSRHVHICHPQSAAGQREPRRS